jgi:hypothetical protein
MSDFYRAQGDTASAIVRTAGAVDAITGLFVATSIQGAGVKFSMTPIRGGASLYNLVTATNSQVGDGSDGSKGRMTFGDAAHPWTAGDAPGDYLAQFQVTFADGTIESFPNDGYLLVTITADPTTIPQYYLAPEELKKTLSLSGTSFADEDVKSAVVAASIAIDNQCGRSFRFATADSTRRYTALSDDWVSVHDLQAVPTSLTVNGSAALVADTDYWLDPVPVASPGPPYGTIRRITTGFSRGTSYAVVVTGKFGWPAVPEPIVAATRIIAARMLRRIREAPFAILPFGDQGEAMRMTQADPDVRFLLGPYVRRDLGQ